MAEVLKTENMSKKFHVGCDQKFTLFSTLRYKLSGENPKKQIWALKDINISVNKGEMIGVIGPNGSGKTTLLRILSGIMAATKGNYHITEKVSSIFELGLGFNPRFTALQNVYLYGALHGYSRKRIDELMPGIVEYSGLHDFMGAKLSEFSSGMRQRLAFSTIIRTVDDVVMVDEALSVGDQAFQKKCIKSFKNLLDKGKTILFVTQNLDGDLKEMCSRALYVNRGEQMFYGDKNDALEMYARDIENQE